MVKVQVDEQLSGILVLYVLCIVWKLIRIANYTSTILV